MIQGNDNNNNDEDDDDIRQWPYEGSKDGNDDAPQRISVPITANQTVSDSKIQDHIEKIICVS